MFGGVLKLSKVISILILSEVLALPEREVSLGDIAIYVGLS